MKARPCWTSCVTVCDNAAQEVCPVWPGQPITAHWGIPDPACVEGTEAERRFAFADAYRMLRQRITIFVNLPIQSLGSLALKKEVDEIGKLPRVVRGGSLRGPGGGGMERCSAAARPRWTSAGTGRPGILVFAARG